MSQPYFFPPQGNKDVRRLTTELDACSMFYSVLYFLLFSALAVIILYQSFAGYFR